MSAHARATAARLAGRPFLLTVAVTAVLLAVSATVAFWPHHAKVRLTAHFPRTVGLYPGSDVRILGIPVGRVTSVTPEGTSVRVRLEYDAAHKVPAGAKAVIVASSVVSDRYVQLTPAYTGGPVMRPGADIPLSRTATPVELDRIYESLNRLGQALGPQGANADGALSRLLAVGADNLGGQGEAVHQSVADLSRAVTTLADGRQDLFGTVRNLQVLTTALARSDATVRAFNDQLAGVSGQLAGEREELGAALRSLATALAEVAAFVHDNAGALRSDLAGLSAVSGVLARQRRALEEILDVAPTALSNLQLGYNPRSGTLDTRDSLAQTQDPALYLCSLLRSAGQPQRTCDQLRAALDLAPAVPPEGQPQVGVSQGKPDLSLGGILGGPR